MAGKIKILINDLMERRARSSEAMRYFLRSHLILKGIHPDLYTETSEDDPAVVEKLEKMLEEHR